jgi:hypothetical protein
VGHQRQDANPPWAGRQNHRQDHQEGGRRAAVIYTLIPTAKLNGIDPQYAYDEGRLIYARARAQCAL